jgi:flagellin-like hook-associated protein FlgL
LSDSERSLLNQEFVALRSEIDRVSANTNFNGTALLNGGDVVSTITEAQAGFLNGKGVSIFTNTSETGADEIFRVSYAYTNAATDTGILTVLNSTTGESQSVDIRALIAAKRTQPATGDLTTDLNAGDTVDVNFNALGITLRLDSRFDVDSNVAFPGNSLTTVGGTAATITRTTLSGTGTFGGTTTAQIYTGANLTGAQYAALTTLDTVTGRLAINVTGAAANTPAVAATAGLEFSRDNITFTSTLAATLIAPTGPGSGFFVRAVGSTNTLARVDLTATTNTATLTTGTISLDISGGFRSVESTSAVKSFTFKVGTGVTVNDDVSFTLGGVTTNALGINAATVDTATNASAAISLLDTAITTVASRRADIGAAQSRLDFASANISTAIENISAARSGLLDVDVSAEITEFTSQQVLVQAGVSLLAQANQQPSLLLRLLQ